MIRTPEKPLGMEEFDCLRKTAHGPHEWDHAQQATYWCWGIKAHPNTMIGRS